MKSKVSLPKINIAKAVKEAEEKRVGFVSIISHQLKTPLSIIKGYLEGLLTGDQGKLKPGQREYLREALEINKETIELVNDYLKYCQLTTGNIVVNPKWISLEEVAEEVIEKMAPLARSSNCVIDYRRQKGKLPKVYVDLIKIKQVIQNILTNAIRYIRGSGRIIIEIQKGKKEIIFSCQDNGVGIPQSEQKEIFTRFFRGKNVINLDAHGSGLGLYLARLVTESSGGKIWYKSKEGKGTTFYFSLPYRK